MLPVLMLYHEHDEDPELQPGPIGPEKREEIIVQMAAGIVRAYRYFRPHRKRVASADEADLSGVQPRLEGTNRVHAVPGESTSAAV